MTHEERTNRIELARRILDWAELHDEFPLPIPMADDLTLFVNSREEALRAIDTFGGTFRKRNEDEYIIMEREDQEFFKVRIWIPKHLTCRIVTETKTVPASEEKTVTVSRWVCPESVLASLKEGVPR
jgi:hypothetical protein